MGSKTYFTIPNPRESSHPRAYARVQEPIAHHPGVVNPSTTIPGNLQIPEPGSNPGVTTMKTKSIMVIEVPQTTMKKKGITTMTGVTTVPRGKHTGAEEPAHQKNADSRTVKDFLGASIIPIRARDQKAKAHPGYQDGDQTKAKDGRTQPKWQRTSWWN